MIERFNQVSGKDIEMGRLPFVFGVGIALLLGMTMRPGFMERSATAAQTGPSWSTDDEGSIAIVPVPMDDAFKNEPWPESWEQEFRERANEVIRRTARDGRYGGTFFENEKRAYGWAMLSILGGYQEQGVAFLESEDADARRWHAHTLGIDFFPSFTLKHQTRKYFYFGHILDPDYRARMKEGARRFTVDDPLGKPHPAFDGATGWGPDAKDSWVDVRSTDNLKLMRETSVYLFAEETGNEATRLLYKQRITEFVVMMFQAGMGEWDSENYMGHSIAPLLNLYDFAKDPEVTLLAKAALDRAAVNLALKYWRGNYCGPSRRDYNHPYPFGGSAAMAAWLWFGQAPEMPTSFESDEAEMITSNYRPPIAVVELARRNFDRPVTITSAKPGGSPWQRFGESIDPAYFETTHYGETFQFGSLALGTQAPDVNGFKILAYSSKRGADTIMAAPVNDPLKLGSPMYEDGVLAPHSIVAQHDQQAIYLTEQNDIPYRFLIPIDARLEAHDHVLLIELERTTIAIWPINLEMPAPDQTATDLVQFRTDRDGERQERWPASRILSAHRRGPGGYGFAIEIHDDDRDAFRRNALECRPSEDEIAIRSASVFVGTSGRRIRAQWGDIRSAVHFWFDGREVDWDRSPRRDAYQTLLPNDASTPLVQQSWSGDGSLTVNAGGSHFRCQVTTAGEVTFEEDVNTR